MGSSSLGRLGGSQFESVSQGVETKEAEKEETLAAYFQ